MLSQWRTTVGNLATHARSGSEDPLSTTPHDTSPSRSNSLDTSTSRSPQSISSSTLAESALGNLRKSFASQRSASPGQASSNRPQSPADQSSTDPNPMPRPPRKSKLEDRLRAAASAIGDTSNTTTPNVSARASPAPEIKENPLSPTSTPLPESPSVTPLPSGVESTVLHTPSSTYTPSPANSGNTGTNDDLPEASIPLPLASDDEVELKVEEESEVVQEDDKIDIREVRDAIHEQLDTPEDSPSTSSEIPIATASPSSQVDVSTALAGDSELLQERLKLIEQRFADVSKSFKRIQAEKRAADLILQELTPVESFQNTEELRSYLQNISLKVEMSQDEIKRLTGKLDRQEERMEEIRDMHRLESTSQSDLIDKLRGQVQEAEALFKASQDTATKADSQSALDKAEIDKLQKELQRSNALAKEEEEKRVKAISLLKTVRQKLVKAEKDREDAVKDLNNTKEHEKEAREKDRLERAKLLAEIETVNTERENAVKGLKAQFDRELAGFRERSEKDSSAMKGQFELEALNMKDAHTEEIQSKNARIASLENSVNALTREKNSLFDQLQVKQAEVESSQSRLDELEGQKTELEYQLREAQDRVAILTDNLADMRNDQEFDTSRGSFTSAEDLARLLSDAETRHESKALELRRNISALEKERNELETDWNRRLKAKIREVEELKRAMDSSTKKRSEGEGVVEGLKGEISQLQAKVSAYQEEIMLLQTKVTQTEEKQAIPQADTTAYESKLAILEKQLEESKTREAQMRANTKTLREELRKVQSSAALLEKQRNPGVGHWASRKDVDQPSEPAHRTSLSSSATDVISRSASPNPSTSPSTSSKSDDELNLEYLRNVILQFLEHKEMRPNLVRVLSIILRFTPQETRRLIAKV